MPIFAVTRHLPDLTTAHLHAVRRALKQAASRVAADGTAVRYLRSVYVPARGACLCLFEAETAHAVARMNEIAQVPFTRIDEAVDMEAGSAR